MLRDVQRSVNRGKDGLGIELRKSAIRASTLFARRKTTRPAARARAAGRPCVVVDPEHVWTFHAREPGASETPEAIRYRDRPASEGKSRTARVHVFEESDSGTVPMNHSNKSGKPPAESEEGRPLIKENTHQLSTHSTQSGVRVSQGLAGVRRAARERKERRFTALLHHLTVALLRDSFYALKRKAAPGVDGVTGQE